MQFYSQVVLNKWQPEMSSVVLWLLPMRGLNLGRLSSCESSPYCRLYKILSYLCAFWASGGGHHYDINYLHQRGYVACLLKSAPPWSMAFEPVRRLGLVVPIQRYFSAALRRLGLVAARAATSAAFCKSSANTARGFRHLWRMYQSCLVQTSEVKCSNDIALTWLY